MGVFTQAWSNWHSSARRLQRREYTQQKRAWLNQQENIKSQQEFRKTEDPREQAGLKQSMFGRGLGKSTISDQDTVRLKEGQARRNAALARGLEYAEQGYELVRARYREARRARYVNTLDQVVSLWMGAGGGAPSQQEQSGQSNQMPAGTKWEDPGYISG